MTTLLLGILIGIRLSQSADWWILRDAIVHDATPLRLAVMIFLVLGAVCITHLFMVNPSTELIRRLRAENRKLRSENAQMHERVQEVLTVKIAQTARDVKSVGENQ